MYQSILLPYSYDALEPFLSAKTINIHYNRHYKNYLKKLNDLLKKNGYNYSDSKEELVNKITQFPISERDDILYNLGGVINHELYFLNMGRKNNIPLGKIEKAINDMYGNFDNFKSEFFNTASKLVGSGYTFLILKQDLSLDIINMSNQETPYSYGFIPIISLDLWEHAYYLDYQNNRESYIKNFFQNIDFSYVNSKYIEAYEKIKEQN